VTAAAWRHPAAAPPQRLLAECDIRHARRSGPGGQHRNKVETAVILTHRSTGVFAEASERRSQAQNQAKAMFRLRVRLALQIRAPIQSDYQPSDLWRSRCRAGRVAINPEHADFPSLLAESLDVLASRDFDIQAAATALLCTASQLVKFLKHEPAALELVNNARAERGLNRLL
jgi:hypothetical protein